MSAVLFAAASSLAMRLFKRNSNVTHPSAQQNTSSIHMLTSVGCLWRIRMGRTH